MSYCHALLPAVLKEGIERSLEVLHGEYSVDLRLWGICKALQE